MRRAVITLAVLAATVRVAAARPDLGSARPLGTLTVYGDDERRGLYYYGPGELEMVRDGDGRPDFHFVLARYLGSAATADRGRVIQRGLLSFLVGMHAPSADELRAARAAVGASELRPLPILRLDASLVYATAGSADQPTGLPPGHFEEAPDEAAAGPGVFWTRRAYSLALAPATAELFWGALTRGQVVLSVSYSFSAAGRASRKEETRVVRAGSFAVSVDAARWPELFRRVDLGARVPPDYPLLDVYCYDFRDALHPALYEKQVEVEAEGVGGRPVSARARFGRDRPDLFARGVRFSMAVRLDRPYRHRVTEVSDDGRSTVGPWVVRASWSELLDVTTPREAGPAAEDPAGGER